MPGSRLTEKDYWPFIVGLWVGGLLTFPFVLPALGSWDVLAGSHVAVHLSQTQLFILSILWCFAIAYARRRDASFSFGRLLLGFGIVVYVQLQAFMTSPQTAQFYFVLPGIGLVLLGSVYGRIGVTIARTARREAIEEEDADRESDHEFTDEDCANWVARSYEARVQGRFDPALMQSDPEISFDSFSGMAESAKSVIQHVFTDVQPEEDEYLISAQVRGKLASHVLTNRYLYMSYLSSRPKATVFETDLRDIESVEFKLGSIYLTLKTGKIKALDAWGDPNMAIRLTKLATLAEADRPRQASEHERSTSSLEEYVEAHQRLPEFVECPSCAEELELDLEERVDLKFKCPTCGRITDLS